MQHIYVIMMTLSALVIACQSSDTRQKCLFPYKYDGVSSENNTSLARCEVLCQRHATCTHFNWICSDKRCAGSRDDPMEEMGTCKLYKGPTSKRLMMKSPQQAWCGRRFYNYRCNFDEIPLLKVEDLSWDQCINLCDLNHQCTHTVLRSNKTQNGYVQRYGICLLFSSEGGWQTRKMPNCCQWLLQTSRPVNWSHSSIHYQQIMQRKAIKRTSIMPPNIY